MCAAFQVTEATDTVILNAVDLEITSVLYKDESGSKIQPQAIEMQPEEKTVTITFPEKLPTEKTGHFEMEFKGKIASDCLKGLYCTKYTR